MAAEAEARMYGGGTPSKGDDLGDTFLTDLMVAGKKPASARRNSSA